MSEGGTVVLSKCFAGGVGSVCAGLITNPCDVIKVRNQQFGSTDTRYRTFRGSAASILRHEGARGFAKGASATVLRECTYSSVRLGLYEPIKRQYSLLLDDSSYNNKNNNKNNNNNNNNGAPSSSPLVKWLSAFTSGAIGGALFNPVDVVKIRFQSSASHQPPYTSLHHAFRTIYAKKGWRGLYIGTSATVVRAAFVTSAELGSYDVVKNDILVRSFGIDADATSTHLLASLVASLITTTAANPADVVKTRVMNDPHGTVGGAYRHLVHVWTTDGIAGFFRGWTASYLRIGPHTVISLVLIEKVRQGIGLASY